MAITKLRLMELMPGYFASLTNTGTASDAVTAATIPRWDTGRLTDKWVYITSGNRIGQSRRVASTSSTTSTLATALTGALASGDTFLILDHDPDILKRAIEDACRNMWPEQTSRGLRGLYREDVQHIIVDNLVDNPFFETSESTGVISGFASYDSTVEGTTRVEVPEVTLKTGDILTLSGTTNYNGTYEIVVVQLVATQPTLFWIRTPFIADDATGTWVEGVTGQGGTASGWTATSGTWTFPRSTRAWFGNHVASASGAATLTQDLFSKVNVQDAVGKTLHVRGADRVGTANIARLRVSFDGGSTFAKSSDYHDGAGDWEGPDKQAIDVEIPSGATTMTIYCDVAAGATPNFGGVWAWIDPVAEYDLTVYHGPYIVEQQVYQDRPAGAYSPLYGRATAGRILKLTGIAPLTVPTSDTMATEADEYEAQLIVAEAAWRMFRALQNQGSNPEYADNERDWRNEAIRLRAKAKSFPGADDQTWWKVSDTNPRKLILGR